MTDTTFPNGESQKLSFLLFWWEEEVGWYVSLPSYISPHGREIPSLTPCLNPSQDNSKNSNRGGVNAVHTVYFIIIPFLITTALHDCACLYIHK